jgi:hypothetical protein
VRLRSSGGRRRRGEIGGGEDTCSPGDVLVGEEAVDVGDDTASSPFPSISADVVGVIGGAGCQG